jgi:acyl-CoA oxidase
MAELRPHAPKLVDAWAFPDSALGRSDGKVRGCMRICLIGAHRKNPPNWVTFNPDWRSEKIVLGSGAAVGEAVGMDPGIVDVLVDVHFVYI